MNDILYMYINKYFSTNLNIFDLIPVVHAQSAVADKIVDNIINEIINPIIFVLFGLAMLVFIRSRSCWKWEKAYGVGDYWSCYYVGYIWYYESYLRLYRCLLVYEEKLSN